MSNLPSNVRLLIDATSFASWVGQAAPRETLEYHRGFLVIDIESKYARLPSHERAQLEQLARQARRLAEGGFVHLVQSRRADGEYSYFAVVRRRSEAPASMTAMLIDEAA